LELEFEFDLKACSWAAVGGNPTLLLVGAEFVACYEFRTTRGRAAAQKEAQLVLRWSRRMETPKMTTPWRIKGLRHVGVSVPSWICACYECWTKFSPLRTSRKEPNYLSFCDDPREDRDEQRRRQKGSRSSRSRKKEGEPEWECTLELNDAPRIVRDTARTQGVRTRKLTRKRERRTEAKARVGERKGSTRRKQRERKRAEKERENNRREKRHSKRTDFSRTSASVCASFPV